MSLAQQIDWVASSPSPAIDLTGTNRLLWVFALTEVGDAAQQVATPSVGGVAMVPFYSTDAGTNSHIDLFLANEATLGALTGSQTITVTGAVNAKKFVALLYTGRGQSPAAPLVDQANNFRSVSTITTPVLAGENFLHFFYGSPNIASVVFNQGRTATYEKNQSGLGFTSLVAYSDIQPTADIGSLAYTTTIASGINNIGSIGLLMPSGTPAVVSDGPYKSGAPDGAAQLQLAGTLAGAAVPGTSPNAYVWLVDDGAGARTFNADGTITTTEPGTVPIGYRVLNATTREWEFYETDVTGVGALGTISFADDIRHSAEETFTTSVDLTGVTNAVLRFTDGAGFAESEVYSGTANGGTISFSLFDDFRQDEDETSGIATTVLSDVELLVNEVVVATGTYRSRAPLGGIATEPASLQPNALPGVEAGKQLLVTNQQGGSTSTLGVYTRANDDPFTLEYYTHDSGIWTRHTQEFFDVGVPVLNTDLLNQTVTVGDTVSLQPDITDAVDNQLDWSFTVNGAAGAAPFAQDATTGLTTVDTTTLAPGDYTIVISGADDAGNITTDTVVLTVDAAATGGGVDLSSIAAGNYGWSDPPFTNFDGVQWESTGTGLRIAGAATTALSRIIKNDAVLNDDIIAAWITVTLNEQDHISPGIAMDDGTAIFAKYAGSGRFDLFMVTPSGVQTGLKQETLTTTPVNPVRLELRWSNTSNTASLFVSTGQIRDQRLLTVGIPAFAPTRAAIVAVGENQNLSEVHSFDCSGTTATVIRALNNSVAPPTITNGEDIIIEWTNANNVANYTVTDEKGNTRALTATAMSANQDFIAAPDLIGLWYGAATITDGSGNSRSFTYGPTIFFNYVNLDSSLDSTATVADWNPGSQIRYLRQSNLNNQVTISTRGIITIGGNFVQYATTQETTGNGMYEPTQQDYVYQDVTEGFTAAAPQGFTSGAPIAINLSALYNPTISLPVTEAGSSGVLMISATLPAGLTRTGAMISGTLPDGMYSIPISVTDPAGHTQATTIEIAVGQAGISSTSVSGLMATSATVTVDVQSMSGSGTYTLCIVALPLGAPTPSNAQLAAGTDANNAPAPKGTTMAPNGIAGSVIPGLNPGTAYQFHVLVIASNGQTTALVLDNSGAGYTTPTPTATAFRASRGKKAAQSRISSNRKSNSNRG